MALALLRRQRIVDAGPRRAPAAAAQGGLDGAAIERLAAAYRDKREHDRDMLERMVFYGQTGHCRWKVLLQHFDEDDGFERCGSCDNCERMASRQAEAESPAAAADAAPQPAPVAHAAFAVGDAVRVKRYGRGTVVAADADTVTVGFDGGGERCFQAGYVKRA